MARHIIGRQIGTMKGESGRIRIVLDGPTLWVGDEHQPVDSLKEALEKIEEMYGPEYGPAYELLYS